MKPIKNIEQQGKSWLNQTLILHQVEIFSFFGKFSSSELEILQLKGHREKVRGRKSPIYHAYLSLPFLEYERLHGAQLRNTISPVLLYLAQAWTITEAMRRGTPRSPQLVEFSSLFLLIPEFREFTVSVFHFPNPRHNSRIQEMCCFDWGVFGVLFWIHRFCDNEVHFTEKLQEGVAWLLGWRGWRLYWS